MAEYFATRYPAVRLLLAGRSKSKLEAVRAELAQRHPSAAASVAVAVADTGDQASVDAAVRAGRVVLSTAGPFMLHGRSVVDACVRAKRDYMDITGEPPYVRDLIDSYHARAASDGTRIIPCMGFDSVVRPPPPQSSPPRKLSRPINFYALVPSIPAAYRSGGLPRGKEAARQGAPCARRAHHHSRARQRIGRHDWCATIDCLIDWGLGWTGPVLLAISPTSRGSVLASARPQTRNQPPP